MVMTLEYLMFNLSKLGVPLAGYAFVAVLLLGFGANSHAQQFADYTLHPGDKIEISVWKEEDLHRTVMIRPDGKFSFPLTGDISVTGRTVAQVQSEIETKLKKYMPEPVVTVGVTDIGGNTIYIIGQVNKAGAYVMSRQLNVLQALSMAAGTTPFAALNDIIIIRGTKTGQNVMPFRYSDVSKGRSLEQNVLLESGDVVVVP
jgi:polysaccharide export outer membrane protein